MEVVQEDIKIEEVVIVQVVGGHLGNDWIVVVGGGKLQVQTSNSRASPLTRQKEVQI